MFSQQQKQEIAAKVEEILLSYGHPEMPTEKPIFQLRVSGEDPRISWADIKPNWVFTDGLEFPVSNPHNEEQAIRCQTPATPAMSEPKPTTEFVTRGGAHEHRYIDGPLICWCPANSCTLEEFKAKREAAMKQP